MKKVIVIVMFLLVAAESLAGQSYFRGRTIVGAGVYAQGGKSILFVKVDGDLSGMENCANSLRFAVNDDLPHFKELVSVALTAYASGKNNVDVFVKGSCNYFGNAQDILGIKIGEMAW